MGRTWTGRLCLTGCVEPFVLHSGSTSPLTISRSFLRSPPLARTKTRAARHEREHPPEVSGLPGHLRLRPQVHHSLGQDGDPHGYLLGLPPVLHGRAEVRRHGRPRRQVLEALRQGWHEGLSQLTRTFRAARCGSAIPRLRMRLRGPGSADRGSRWPKPLAAAFGERHGRFRRSRTPA